MTRVASTSTTSGAPASIPWSGARPPACCQARARACARAVWIARNAAVGSAAIRSIVRDTVGSEATGPNRPGSARSTANSRWIRPPPTSTYCRGLPPCRRGFASTEPEDTAVRSGHTRVRPRAHLLVTTLDPTDAPGAWSDPGALWVAIGTEVVAFFLAFAVVAFYGRSNHAFVARLHHLGGRLVTVNLVSLAFVVLLPFSTDALGQFPQPLAKAVFAGNVALIACMEAVLSLLAWRDGLMSAPPSPADAARAGAPARRLGWLLASIPVAYLVSSATARLSATPVGRSSAGATSPQDRAPQQQGGVPPSGGGRGH